MNSILSGVEACCLFTGTNGRRGCTANCRGCFVGEFEASNSMYQGNTEQVHELLGTLPNLRRVNIVGNPDPSVDTEFCNVTARLIQQKGKEISFCTNGVRCDEVVKKLVEGLEPSLIHAIVFSIDSLDEKLNTFMKGTKISLQKIFQTMKHLKGMGIGVQAFFTIWPDNMDEDWTAYTDFFESQGVYTSGRFGNVESAQGRVAHISEDNILQIRKKHNDVRLSILLANDDEYNEYLSTFVANDEFRCTDLKKINVYLTEGEIKASYYCPMASTIYPIYFAPIQDLKRPFFYEDIIKTGYCPIAEQCMGFKSTKLHPICRFHKNLPKKILSKESHRLFN